MLRQLLAAHGAGLLPSTQDCKAEEAGSLRKKASDSYVCTGESAPGEGTLPQDFTVHPVLSLRVVVATITYDK